MVAASDVQLPTEGSQMTETLFGEDEPTSDEAAARSECLPSWQVDGLRESLDRSGLKSQAERRAAVEEIVGRSVGALRELTHREAGLVRDELRRRTYASRSESRSAWDERDEDTWLDRL